MGVTLDTLDHAIEFLNDLDPGAQVRTVQPVHRFDELQNASAGTVIVLGPALASEVGTYKFDVALANASPGVVAVIGGSAEPMRLSLTSRRIAKDRSIALGRLRESQDAVALGIWVHDHLLSDGHEALQILDRLQQEIAACEGVDAIAGLVERAGTLLKTPLTLVDRPLSQPALPIRVQTQIRHFLECGTEPHSALVAAASAQLARHIESVLQADYEQRELAESTRSELINETLLSDTTTGADAINRLRRSGFPIDGSHYAIRIDCHDPLPDGAPLPAVARCQARIADLFLEAARTRPGQWTRAGTANSILLISTRVRPHSDLVGREAEQVVHAGLGASTAQFAGLVVHIGIGTSHLGPGGIRTTVTEATTAARAARTRGAPNTPEPFDRLGFGRALVRWAEIDGVRPVINEIMKPILDLPERQGREALETLRAYLDCGQNAAKTAERLHLHRNTVRYRLDRITELLPVDLKNPEDRLLVELSCRIAETTR